MNKKIFAWVKQPGQPARHVWISNRLEALQANVGGYIEVVPHGNAVVICNEEGRLLGLPYNCVYAGTEFVGTIIICGVDGEEFADCPEDVNEAIRLFNREGLW